MEIKLKCPKCHNWDIYQKKWDGHWYSSKGGDTGAAAGRVLAPLALAVGFPIVGAIIGAGMVFRAGKANCPICFESFAVTNEHPAEIPSASLHETPARGVPVLSDEQMARAESWASKLSDESLARTESWALKILNNERGVHLPGLLSTVEGYKTYFKCCSHCGKYRTPETSYCGYCGFR